MEAEYQKVGDAHDNIADEPAPAFTEADVQQQAAPAGGFFSAVTSFFSSAATTVSNVVDPPAADASMEKMEYQVPIEQRELADDEVSYLVQFITDPQMEIRANYSRHKLQRIFRKLELGANAAFTTEDQRFITASSEQPAMSEREVREMRDFIDNGTIHDQQRLHNIFAKMTAGAYRSGRLPSPLIGAMQSMYNGQAGLQRSGLDNRRYRERNAAEEVARKRQQEQMELERRERERVQREREQAEQAKRDEAERAMREAQQREETDRALKAAEARERDRDQFGSLRQRKRTKPDEPAVEQPAAVPPPQPAMGKTPPKPEPKKSSNCLVM